MSEKKLLHYKTGAVVSALFILIVFAYFLLQFLQLSQDLARDDGGDISNQEVGKEAVRQRINSFADGALGATDEEKEVVRQRIITAPEGYNTFDKEKRLVKQEVLGE